MEDEELHDPTFARQHRGIDQQDARDGIGGAEIRQSAVEAGLNVVAANTVTDEIDAAVGIEACGLRSARRIGDRKAEGASRQTKGSDSPEDSFHTRTRTPAQFQRADNGRPMRPKWGIGAARRD
ncbi:MAG TPA: hypothetical protein VFV47_03685 [Hyphomicrobiaceae bacterium]|nr:hypothetical protein [Hyphomicrobiaceae bacterium]